MSCIKYILHIVIGYIFVLQFWVQLLDTIIKHCRLLDRDINCAECTHFLVTVDLL
jgi:hypothetical protein